MHDTSRGRPVLAPQFVRWFAALGEADIAQVGGKNASLGELNRELKPREIRVPSDLYLTMRRSPCVTVC